MQKAMLICGARAHVTGYGIEVSDGSVGHVETFLFDDASWAIRPIVVDTRNWSPGKHVVTSGGTTLDPPHK